VNALVRLWVRVRLTPSPSALSGTRLVWKFSVSTWRVVATGGGRVSASPFSEFGAQPADSPLRLAGDFRLKGSQPIVKVPPGSKELDQCEVRAGFASPFDPSPEFFDDGQGEPVMGRALE
jgi:hypothetical protein